MEAANDFVNVAFEILDKNAILTILKKLNPRDILNLCEVNNRFKRICSDKAIFIELMIAHYPNEKLDNENPKQQYFERITYVIFLKGDYHTSHDEEGKQITVENTFDNKAYFFDDKYQTPDHIYEIIIDVPYPKMRNGVKIYLLVDHFEASNDDYIFDTEKEMMECFFNTFYDNIEKYYSKKNIDTKNLRKRIYDFIKLNHFYYLDKIQLDVENQDDILPDIVYFKEITVVNDYYDRNGLPPL